MPILREPWQKTTIKVANPYSVEVRRKGFCVVKTDSGEVVKCHPTRAAALAHHRALEANVGDA
jgi:hypothetical protein